MHDFTYASIRSMYGFFLFCFIVEVSNSKYLQISSNIAIDNFETFDVAAISQMLYD